MKNKILLSLFVIIIFASCKNNVSEIIKKAEQGDSQAQVEYARLLRTTGNGVEQNWDKVIEMFQNAAHKGNTDALWELGAMYEFANHIKQDSLKAVSLYRQSANNGNPIGQYMLAHCYQHGIGVKENHTISDSIYAKSVEGLNKLLPNEDIYVLNFIGSAYFWGDGVKVDREKAFGYYLISAEKGNPETQYKIGNCYETGEGTTKDMENAMKWYKKAASQGYNDAIKALERLK